MLKTTGLLLLAGLTTAAARAQDVLTTTDGDKLEIKVDEITPRMVLYHKADNPTGPQYSISKREVSGVEYENGTREDFGYRRGMDNHGRGDRFRIVENSEYGKNILTLAPVFISNEGTPGFGIQYERMLERRGILSLSLPFAIGLDRNYDLNSYNANTGRYRQVYQPFYHAYPGIKVYPTGSQGVVRYSIGASMDLGFGNKYFERNNPYTGQYYGVTESVFKAGMMINNGLNFMPTRHFYIGMELGLGFYYVNTENDYYGSINDGPAAQFNFKVGYRF